MVPTKKKSVALRDKSALLYADKSDRKEKKNSPIRKSRNIFGVAPEDARLTLLEVNLATRAQYIGTPFADIDTISNPSPVDGTDFPLLQIWFDTYRTTARSAIAGSMHMTQEVITGMRITSSKSDEESARRQCYALGQELEDRFIGYQPDIPDTEIIFPMYDIDASFSLMEATGLFSLDIYFSLTWVVQKIFTRG